MAQARTAGEHPRRRDNSVTVPVANLRELGAGTLRLGVRQSRVSRSEFE